MKSKQPLKEEWREKLRESGRDLADTLQDYNGIRECKVCGADPEKQAEWVIKLVEEQVSQTKSQIVEQILGMESMKDEIQDEYAEIETMYRNQLRLQIKEELLKIK